MVVEFDYLDGGCGTALYNSGDNVNLAIKWATEELEECGGGHADIFNDEGEFLADVEV